MEDYPWPLPAGPEARSAYAWYDTLLKETPPPRLVVGLLHPETVLPVQLFPGGGWLLHASPLFDTTTHPLQPRQRMSIPTAIRVTIPEGYVAMILPLSHEDKPIQVWPQTLLSNRPVDVYVRVANKSTEKRMILPKACLAQLVLIKVAQQLPLEVQNAWDDDREA